VLNVTRGVMVCLKPWLADGVIAVSR